MTALAMFIPLAKADAVQRLVYGSFDETPDAVGEICDYATAKAQFQAWSDSMQKASNGKSLGNVRAQHDMKKAAGKLTEISFDDDAKRIDFVAKIVDDQEWEKVEEGVYTGFSPGGKYAKRWQDGAHKRYTPTVRELSIVDVPCNPSATFTMIKADGEEEEREFVLAKAYEPGNDATKARAEDMAKAAGGDAKAKDFVAQARADLISENAADALAKLAPDEEAEPKADPAAALDAALNKASKAITKAATAPEDGPVEYRDLAKASAALGKIAAAVGDEPLLQKGLWSIERTARALECFGSILSDVAWEEQAENDTDSKLPQMAADLVGKIKAFIIEMANEEVAELLASVTARLPDFNLVIEPVADDEAMELAAAIVDLVKADDDLMAKAGARNSKGDAAMIQSMHDNAVELGATCDTSAEKAATLEAENDRLTKAFDSALPKVEALASQVEQLTADRAADREALAKATAEIADLKARPELAKGIIRAVSKEEDQSLSKTDGSTTDELTLEKVNAMPAGPERSQALEKLAWRQQIANSIPG